VIHRIARLTLAAALGAAPLVAQTPPPPAPPAAPASPEELEQRVRILERKLELAEEQKTEKEKSAAVVAVGAEGFTLKSAQGDYQLRLRALVQTDGRFFTGDAERPLTDTFVVRRARPILEGALGKRVEFRLMPDFGAGTSTLADAYFDVRIAAPVKLRIGKAKVPVGLEALLEDANLPFVERGLPSNLAPVRDVGVQATGEPLGGRLVYALGVFNGVPDAGSGDGDNGDDKDWAARLFFRPFQRPAAAAPARVGLGLGMAASVGRQSGSASAPNLPVYRSPGLQTVFSYRSDGTAAGTAIAAGDRTRLAPQGWLYTGPFLVFAEWTESRQRVASGAVNADLAHRAWQLSATWAVTGEPISERGLVPRRPFDPASGGHGALLVSARYGVLEVDDAAFPVHADPAKSVRRAADAGASLGWLLNRNVKFVLDYQQTAFDGGAVGGDRPTEKALLVRAQLAF